MLDQSAPSISRKSCLATQLLFLNRDLFPTRYRQATQIFNAVNQAYTSINLGAIVASLSLSMFYLSFRVTLRTSMSLDFL